MSASMGGGRDLAARLGRNSPLRGGSMNQLTEAMQIVVMGIFVLAILIAIIKS